ncbi:unnamed protein product [Discosporangium mesarthrocarpum]
MLQMDQHIYITITDRLDIGMMSIPPASTNAKLSLENCPSSDKDYMKRIPYREAGGALMWALTMTRPEISDAVSNMAH